MNKVRLPFNVNALSQAVAVSALEKKDLMRQYVKSVISEREKLFKELSDIKGIVAYPSEANFILFKMEDPDHVYQSLLKKAYLCGM